MFVSGRVCDPSRGKITYPKLHPILKSSLAADRDPKTGLPSPEPYPKSPRSCTSIPKGRRIGVKKPFGIEIFQGPGFDGRSDAMFIGFPLGMCVLLLWLLLIDWIVNRRDPSRRRAKRTVDVQRGSVRNISPKVVLTRQRTKTASPKYKQRNRGHPTSYVVREGSLQNISPRVVLDPFWPVNNNIRKLGSSEVYTNKLWLTALNPSTKYSTRSTLTPWCSLFPLSQSSREYVVK